MHGKALKLKMHLIVLVVGAVLPMLMFGCIMTVLLTRQRERVVANGMLETARALTLAVDARLYSSSSTLEAMAVSGHLSSGDLRAFYRSCQRIRPTQKGWLSVYLLDGTGHQIFNLLRPWGTALPDGTYRDLYRQIVQSGKPVIAGLFNDDIAGVATVAIATPVWRDGQMKYVLGAVLDRQLLVDLLLREKGPPDRLAAILDPDLRVLARSRSDPQMLGRHATPIVSAAIGRSSEGFFKDHSLDGVLGDGAFSRSALSGWTVVLATPAATVGAIVVQLMRSVIAVGLFLLLAGVVVAGFYARRISRPILELLPAAHAVGRDEPLGPIAPSSVKEVNDLCQAIHTASHLLQQRSRERQAAEEQRAQIEADLRRANQSKDEFLALLSHELRNPIGAISNAAEVLGQPGSPADRQAFLRDVIVRQARHLAILVDDLLDVSRVTTGKIGLHRQPLDLAQVVRRCVESMTAGGRVQDHLVAITADPVPVEGDPARLQQITTNLLDNAVKYTPAGGLIRVSVKDEGKQAVLRVQDNGNGISPQVLPRVFDLFVQEDRSLAHAAGGLGIGLTLVRRLAEMHGGTVEARSAGPGQGSEFVVRLPRLPDWPPSLGREQALSSLLPHRVLVVDDNADSRETLQALLEVLGQSVELAANADQAVAAVTARRPDIAFIDIGMPEIDGYTLARMIRELPDGKGLPLVALTGYGLAEDRRRSGEAGFDAHQVKPVGLDQLAVWLERLDGGHLRSGS